MLCASCRIINYNRRATKKNTILCNKGNGLQSLFNYPKQKLVSYLLAITGANAVLANPQLKPLLVFMQ